MCYSWEELLGDNYLNYLKYQDYYSEKSFPEAVCIFKKILPEYFNIVHLINCKHIKENLLPDFGESPYDLGIFLVGHSIMPVILSIAEIRPKSIIFVTSDDTTGLVDEIKDGVKILDSEYYRETETEMREEKLDELSDPARIFQKINSLIPEYKNKKIAIDITGGKKTMVAGSFMASAHSRTCDIFYIDFEEYDPRRREPCYGTEFLARLPNPSEIFSIADWERIESLFDKYQFRQVTGELARTENNINKHKTYFDEETTSRLEKIKKYAKGYESWDDYQYKDAFKLLPDEPGLKILEKIPNSAEKEDLKEIYNNNDRLAYYLSDRFENAQRRKSQGQLQGAFLRFITLTEFALTLWAETELDKKEKKKENLLDFKDNIKFGKLISYLESKQCAVADKIDLPELRKLTYARNKHVLIHSISLIDDNELNKSESFAEQVIRNILAVKGLGKDYFDSARQNLKFRRFSDL